jgi:RecB family endonuclease NucS
MVENQTYTEARVFACVVAAFENDSSNFDTSRAGVVLRVVWPQNPELGAVPSEIRGTTGNQNNNRNRHSDFARLMRLVREYCDLVQPDGSEKPQRSMVQVQSSRMPTMAEALEDYLRSAGKPVTSETIRRDLEARYPNQWKPGTYAGHLYGCVVNNPKAYLHHPSFKRFIYRNQDGTFVIYDEKVHGPNEWAPAGTEDEAEAVAELAEFSIGLERDLEDHLVLHLDEIESGLTLIGRQVSIEIGRVDILARDNAGKTVIIEVKVGEAKDSHIGQVARYAGWFARKDGQTPRAILIAASFSEGVRYAATAVANLQLLAYRVSFAFKSADL